MPNGTYGGVRGRKTKVGRKLLRFPPTRFDTFVIYKVISIFMLFVGRMAFSLYFFPFFGIDGRGKMRRLPFLNPLFR